MGKFAWFDSIKKDHSLLILFVIGLILRLPFVPLTGFEQDFLFFSSWASYLAENSLITIYDNPAALSVGFINYPPLYLYILQILARIHQMIFESPLESWSFMVMIKLTTIFFEALFSCILYTYISKLYDAKTGCLAFAFYFLNPAVIYVSAYYGQVDAIFTGLIFVSILFLVEQRFYWSGVFIALALLCKLQTLPFVPFLFLIPLLRLQWRAFFWQALGFVSATLVILLPFILYGRIGVMIQNSVIESVEWGKYLSVGAFNLWYLHVDPYTYDFRLWGWLYGSDHQVEAFPGITLLTYKNLGILLFGAAFVLSLFLVWQNKNKNSVWLGAALVAFAFYMFPTKVHERYLYPFFLLYLPVLFHFSVRKGLFIGLSLSYLINLVIICPLFGEIQPVEQIHSTWGDLCAILNIIAFCIFIIHDFYGNIHFGWYNPKIRNAITAGAAIALILFLANQYEQHSSSAYLYLSHLQPNLVQQDWPPIAEELPPGYRQLKKDLSSDGNVLQIAQQYFRYGLGAHAVSIVEYDVDGDYQIFETWIGVDKEVFQIHQELPHVATVTFEVWINDQLEYQSPLMIPSMAAKHVSISLPNQERNKIKLIVRDGGDQINITHSDHADWALARVVKIDQ